MSTAAHRAHASAEKNGRSPTSKRLLRIGLAGVVLYCGLGSALVLYDGARLISAQYETTYPESANAYLAVVGARTGRLYHSYFAMPYVVQAYGPLFYATDAAIARVSKLEIDLTIRRGRMLSSVCFLLCAFAVFEISRRLEFSTGPSLLAAAMLISQPAFIFWNATMRPEMAALFGMLLSLFFSVRKDQPEDSDVILSGLAAGMAFLFKQSAICAPAAVALVFACRRKIREILLLAAGATAPILAVLAFLLWRHEGFAQHFFALLAGRWSLADAARWFLKPRALSMLPVPLIVGGTGMIGAARENHRSKIIASFALIALLEGFVTETQVGADVNYFLPAIAGCCLLLPFAMRVVVRQSTSPVAVAIIAVVVLFAGTAVDAVVCNRYRPRGDHAEINYSALKSLSVLSDDPYLAMHAGDPGMLDPFTSHDFELKAKWNPRPIVAEIQRGQFDLVVIRGGHVVPSYRGISYFGWPIIDAINESYRILCTAGDTIVLEPRSRNAPITTEALGGIVGTCTVSANGTAPELTMNDGAR